MGVDKNAITCHRGWLCLRPGRFCRVSPGIQFPHFHPCPFSSSTKLAFESAKDLTLLPSISPRHHLSATVVYAISPLTTMAGGSATAILFNSPALHALKRDQLLKLCKNHGIKASGKNSDLVARLQQYALSLSPDIAASGTATDTDDVPSSEPVEDGPSDSQGIRPSQQWEMIMDTITEADESGLQGTLRSMKSVNSTNDLGSTGSKGRLAFGFSFPRHAYINTDFTKAHLNLLLPLLALERPHRPEIKGLLPRGLPPRARSPIRITTLLGLNPPL
jgi:hypothetical protein